MSCSGWRTWSPATNSPCQNGLRVLATGRGRVGAQKFEMTAVNTFEMLLGSEAL